MTRRSDRSEIIFNNHTSQAQAVQKQVLMVTLGFLALTWAGFSGGIFTNEKAFDNYHTYFALLIVSIYGYIFVLRHNYIYYFNLYRADLIIGNKLGVLNNYFRSNRLRWYIKTLKVIMKLAHPHYLCINFFMFGIFSGILYGNNPFPFNYIASFILKHFSTSYIAVNIITFILFIFTEISAFDHAKKKNPESIFYP